MVTQTHTFTHVYTHVTAQVLLHELEPGSSEPLSIDLAAAAQLLPDGRSNSKKQQHMNLSSKDRFVLGYEVDGMMQPRHSLVTLRMDPPSQRVQVHGPLALDTLQGRKLAAWRREVNGRLVAVLHSNQAAEEVAATTSQPSLTPTPSAAVPAHPIDLPPSTPVADPHQPFLQAAQHQIQQQFAFSAAGAAAVLSAAQQAMHLPPVRTRTFTPSRVRPISEVYVPFRLWRELFDGSMKPVPPSGVPLQIVVTGAVQLSQQEVVLVRQITRYGYFVLKGIKGLSRLRGKLLVRWSLLISGVLEMEVVDEPAVDEPAEDEDEVQLLADKKGGKRSSRR